MFRWSSESLDFSPGWVVLHATQCCCGMLRNPWEWALTKHPISEGKCPPEWLVAHNWWLPVTLLWRRRELYVPLAVLKEGVTSCKKRRIHSEMQVESGSFWQKLGLYILRIFDTKELGSWLVGEDPASGRHSENDAMYPSCVSPGHCYNWWHYSYAARTRKIPPFFQKGNLSIAARKTFKYGVFL